jgi:hypothetical protein
VIDRIAALTGVALIVFSASGTKLIHGLYGRCLVVLILCAPLAVVELAGWYIRRRAPWS